MEIILNTPEKMLMALLKASLNQQVAEKECFVGVSDADWKQCYQLAARQGVMALAWDGVKTLPADVWPPRSLKLNWAIAVEAYEKKYARYCRTIEELTSFYADRKIAVMQMKGVGLSAYYPVPAHREGGDIDIFTYSADPAQLSDEEANRLADALMEEQGIEVDMHSPKHSNFYYKGIPIENHKTFLNVERYEVAVQVEAILKKVMQPQPTELLDGTCRIWTPSPAFNTLFLAFHASQHYGSGIALHHLCDWAVLIQRYGLKLPDELTDKRFREAIAAFTCLCNRYLGTEVKMDGGEALADEVMHEMLHPKYPPKQGIPVKGKMRILTFKTKRFLHMSKVSNRIFYIPLWKRIGKSVVEHLKHPETIFRT